MWGGERKEMNETKVKVIRNSYSMINQLLGVYVGVRKEIIDPKPKTELSKN